MIDDMNIKSYYEVVWGIGKRWLGLNDTIDNTVKNRC